MLDFFLWLLLTVLWSGVEETSTPSRQPSTANRQPPVEFVRDVQPILEKRCQPCHFPGGTMHAKLPFDKPETIHKLGTKLFTRIKKDDEQAVLRAFLAQR
ncbi:MAG TPA: hypothetical protein VGQ36_13335 [Thermoanaerobaculia bacterium]|jgi:hypothetical protein|nr:hypothetical protein [Thermoanaerobaculia bacterium]